MFQSDTWVRFGAEKQNTALRNSCIVVSTRRNRSINHFNERYVMYRMQKHAVGESNFSIFSLIDIDYFRITDICTYPKPRLKQATMAAVSVNMSSHTVPHVPLPLLISSRPSLSEIPIRRTCTETHQSAKSYIHCWQYFICSVNPVFTYENPRSASFHVSCIWC